MAKPAARLARFPFLLVLIGIFGIGMAGLLMLNTTLQGQAFQSRTLNRQAAELAYAQADLENQLDALAAPQELARRASALGMRTNPYPAFLVLPSGKVIGKPTPVQGDEVPAFIVKTPAEVAAERAAKRARVEARAAAKAAKLEQQKAAAVGSEAQAAEGGGNVRQARATEGQAAVIKSRMVSRRLVRCAVSCCVTARLSPRGLAFGKLHRFGRFGRLRRSHLCGCHSPRPTAGCTHLLIIVAMALSLCAGPAAAASGLRFLLVQRRQL